MYIFKFLESGERTGGKKAREHSANEGYRSYQFYNLRRFFTFGAFILVLNWKQWKGKSYYKV